MRDQRGRTADAKPDLPILSSDREKLEREEEVEECKATWVWNADVWFGHGRFLVVFLVGLQLSNSGPWNVYYLSCLSVSSSWMWGRQHKHHAFEWLVFLIFYLLNPEAWKRFTHVSPLHSVWTNEPLSGLPSAFAILPLFPSATFFLLFFCFVSFKVFLKQQYTRELTIFNTTRCNTELYGFRLSINAFRVRTCWICIIYLNRYVKTARDIDIFFRTRF